jgi:hypothetical protein
MRDRRFRSWPNRQRGFSGIDVGHFGPHFGARCGNAVIFAGNAARLGMVRRSTIDVRGISV